MTLYESIRGARHPPFACGPLLQAYEEARESQCLFLLYVSDVQLDKHHGLADAVFRATEQYWPRMMVWSCDINDGSAIKSMVDVVADAFKHKLPFISGPCIIVFNCHQVGHPTMMAHIETWSFMSDFIALMHHIDTVMNINCKSEERSKRKSWPTFIKAMIEDTRLRRSAQTTNQMAKVLQQQKRRYRMIDDLAHMIREYIDKAVYMKKEERACHDAITTGQTIRAVKDTEHHKEQLTNGQCITNCQTCQQPCRDPDKAMSKDEWA